MRGSVGSAATYTVRCNRSMRTRTKAACGASAAFVLASALTTSCSRDPTIEERSVFVYSPKACAVSESDAYSFIYAVGDYEPPANQPPAAGVFLRERGREMPELPASARALIADISQGDIDWRGVTKVPASGPINVLVWPGGRACNLTRDVERREDAAFGVFGRHFLVAGGRTLAGAQVPHTFVGDLSTGAIQELAVGLTSRRSAPTVTRFATSLDDSVPSGALVAGGHDPDSDVDGIAIRPLASAEVYEPKGGSPGDIGEFAPARIDLSEPRAHHGAAVLSTGETLLVGGRGAAGLLRTMEIVDPSTRRARTAGVALLAIARESPTVLRLANGEILVAGGVDGSGNAVPTLEWFSADASRPTKRPVDLVTGIERAFVPLEAGGALAVIRPGVVSADFKTVWVISADGALEPGEALDASVLDTVRLFSGTDGAPALWTGRRWMRWSPWLARFDAMTNAPDGSAGGITGPELPATANGDAGLALWLATSATTTNVIGFRFATRTPWDRVPKPLLTAGVERFAPDRIATETSGTIRFDRTLGLVLGTGASAFLTDATFAAFDAELDITSNAPTVVLRSDRGDELEVGGLSCAYAQTAKTSLRIRREAERVLVSIDGAPARPCPTLLEPGARVSLGLRGTAGVSSSSGRNLRVIRQ